MYFGESWSLLFLSLSLHLKSHRFSWRVRQTGAEEAQWDLRICVRFRNGRVSRSSPKPKPKRERERERGKVYSMENSNVREHVQPTVDIEYPVVRLSWRKEKKTYPMERWAKTLINGRNCILSHTTLRNNPLLKIVSLSKPTRVKV